MKPGRILSIILVGLGAAVVDVNAVTKVEGEYQLQLDIRKQDRAFPWDFESNHDDTWAASQFRIFSSPREGVEAYVRLEADWNTGSNNEERPVYQYREAHLRFRRNFGDSEFDAYLFSREDRFWVDNHLLQPVQGGGTTDGGNAQGARVDIRRWKGLDATYIVSDFSSQSKVGGSVTTPPPSDDAHVFRLRRNFLDNAMRAGMTYTRKLEAQDGEQGFNQVYAVDFRFTVRNTDLFVEFADSRVEGAGENRKPDGTWEFGDYEIDEFHRILPRDAAFKAEFRSIRFGSPKVGFYNIAPSYYYFGEDYASFLGEGTNDLVGYKINTWYLVPGRAVTVTLDWEENRRSVFEQKKYTRFRTEIYTEYVNGFTSKFWYDRQLTVDFSNELFDEETKNFDFFAEVQVESRLAWMRVQGKIKDLDTKRRKELASLETSINIIPQVLKVYNRYVFGNDPARLRKGLFSEIQYRPRDNMDIFLSYGPWWIGDDANPVNDGDLAGGADNKDIIRVIVKGNF